MRHNSSDTYCVNTRFNSNLLKLTCQSHAYPQHWLASCQAQTTRLCIQLRIISVTQGTVCKPGIRTHLQQSQQWLCNRSQIPGKEAVCMAISSQTACPTHPMNVGVQICREVIVDDVGQVLDVQAPCSYISSYQNLGFARFPAGHSFLQHLSTFQHLTCLWLSLHTSDVLTKPGYALVVFGCGIIAAACHIVTVHVSAGGWLNTNHT